MTVRLLLDEMYPPALAETLRGKGHDVVAVVASGDLIGRDDASVLEAATAAGQCLVTENVRDFAALSKYTRHGGILLVAAGRWRRTSPGLVRLANALHEAITDGVVPGPNEVRWLSA